jgi:hypothetical protein
MTAWRGRSYILAGMVPGVLAFEDYGPGGVLFSCKYGEGAW